MPDATSLPTAALLHGDDEFQIRDALTRFINASVPKADRQVAVTRLSGREMDSATLCDALDTSPLFTARSLVVIEGVESMAKAERDALPERIRTRAPSTSVALTYLCKDSRDAPPKALLDLCHPYAFQALSDKTAPQWVIQRAAKKGLSIDRDAADLLVARIGGADSGRLASEIEKYRSIIIDGRSLSADVVMRMTDHSRGARMFQFLDAVAEKKAALAFATLDILHRDGDELTPVISILGSKLAKMQEVRAYKDARMSVPAHVTAGPGGWNHERHAANWTSDGLSDALSDACMLDVRVKSGGDARQLLERFVLSHAIPVSSSTRTVVASAAVPSLQSDGQHRPHPLSR